jgi:hypothetical protein
MDGTIANLYGVKNWLEDLRAEIPRPYKIAKANVNLSLLARYLNKLRAGGYKIGIISWTSKQSSREYEEQVTAAKIDWLINHLPSVWFNEINIMPYGTDKNIFNEGCDLLFDDDIEVRRKWTGESYPPEQIFDVLHNLISTL